MHQKNISWNLTCYSTLQWEQRVLWISNRMAPPSARDGCNVSQDDDFKHLATCSNAEPFFTPALTATCSCSLFVQSLVCQCVWPGIIIINMRMIIVVGRLPIETHSRCLYSFALTTPWCWTWMNYSRLMLQFCPCTVPRGLHIASSEKEHRDTVKTKYEAFEATCSLHGVRVCLCTKGDDGQSYFRGKLKFTANAGLCRSIKVFRKLQSSMWPTHIAKSVFLQAKFTPWWRFSHDFNCSILLSLASSYVPPTEVIKQMLFNLLLWIFKYGLFSGIVICLILLSWHQAHLNVLLLGSKNLLKAFFFESAHVLKVPLALTLASP